VVREDGVLYASGQVPVDPQIRQVVDGGIEVETWQTREYLKSTLTLACASLADVVKVNTFFTDMTSFSAINGVSREYFPSEPLARTTVGTTGLANPAMQIEIEVIAPAPES